MEATSKPLKRCCLVCGDKSVGFNYSTLTCESCKVFFHRNATKLDQLHCRKEGNCPIDEATRKSCAHCRLVKCFATGMRWDGRGSNKKLKSETTPTPTNSTTIRAILEAADDAATDLKTLSSQNNNEIPPQIVPNGTFLLKAQPSKRKYASTLTIFERTLIAEVQAALTVFEDESQLPFSGDVVNPLTAINLPVCYTRRMVKFAKRLSAFKPLCEADKLTILKPFFIELNAIRTSFGYDIERDGYLILENESGTRAVFMSCKLGDDFTHDEPEFMASFRRFIKQLKIEMEDDSTIRDLFIVLHLFRPRANLVSCEYIRYQFFIYSRLLLVYLEHKYHTVKTANAKYTALNRFTPQLDEVIAKSVQILSRKVAKSQLDALLSELYQVPYEN